MRDQYYERDRKPKSSGVHRGKRCYIILKVQQKVQEIPTH